uniref:ribonucleases P/MRP protein subunit POP1 isoform X3 n=1 Tax=Myxine glutinosa TaxID=7769 RepID=UPI00358FCECE
MTVYSWVGIPTRLDMFETQGTQAKPVSKCRSRKARRQHRNLLEEYNRRQRHHVWLETHVWHAKRFHMKECWGYRLAERPSAKTFRISFRAMDRHCLLQDISYYSCIEVSGRQEDLLQRLCRLTSKEAGMTFASKECLGGRRQGSLVLYKVEGFPSQPLGPVTFIWRPLLTPVVEESKHRQLWIWIHPAMKKEVIEELQQVIGCLIPVRPKPSDASRLTKPVPEGASGNQSTGHDTRRKKKRSRSAARPEKVLGDGTRHISDATSWITENGDMVLTDLTMELVRLRLVGPLANCVLTTTLHLADSPQVSEEGPTSWWTKHSKDPLHRELHEKQRRKFSLLAGLQATSDVPSGTILGLTVGDPRLDLPSKRSKALPGRTAEADREDAEQFTRHGFDAQLAWSALWDYAIRDEVTKKKMPEQELNELRRKVLVPGSRLNLGAHEAAVPMLLVQQGGRETGRALCGWGAAWDIILPKGWAMAFWIPLVYREALVGGLRESERHSMYRGVPHFPDDFPDCVAGARHTAEYKAQALDKFKRYPPDKRPNYVKLGVQSPFAPPWDLLAQEWDAMQSDSKDFWDFLKLEGENQVEGFLTEQQEVRVEEDEPQVSKDMGDECKEASLFYTIRNQRLLARLAVWCGLGRAPRRPAGLPESSDGMGPSLAESLFLASSHSYGFVWVRLELLERGTPEHHAAVSIPSSDDLAKLKADKTYSGPLEPKQSDPFKPQLRAEGKQKKIEKGKKKKKKNRDQEKRNYEDENECEDVLIKGLHPEPLSNVVSHCSRLLLGSVARGDFSLAEGAGRCFGFVSLVGLLRVILHQQLVGLRPPGGGRRPLVLVRNPNSLQYRFAWLSVEVQWS